MQFQPPPNQPQYPSQPEQHQQPLSYPQPQYIPPVQPPKKKPMSFGKFLAIGCGGLTALVVLLIVIGAVANARNNNTSNAASQATQPAQEVTQMPTPQSVHYPPTTGADLRGLAAKGDASAIHEFYNESVGLTGVCPQPKREVTVDASLTGQQLAEDLLAYFYGQQLDSPCGSLVLAYHSQSEAGNAYTAGRINFDVTSSSGATNMDPNATTLTYTLTLDIGDVATGQEYTVTYSQ